MAIQESPAAGADPARKGAAEGNDQAELSRPSRAGTKAWVALAVLALPTLLVSLDTFVMVLALPEIATGLGASSAEQLWIMDIYGFMVGGFMITMGTLGDRIGRRRLLLLGAACFGIASMVAAFSTTPLVLIASRAALGIAGAALTPSTLALISNIFTDAKQRATAIGVWAACFAIGAIIGPIVGGVLLEHFWWGSVMLLGVPAMVLLLIAGPMLLPEYRDRKAGRLDLASVVLSLMMILPIIFGLKEFARHGWQTLPAVSLVVGVLAGWYFLRRQSQLTDPLIDLRLFADKVFTTVLVSMLAFTVLSGSAMIFVAQYVQLVEGWSPLRAAYALLPGMAVGLVSFQVTPMLSRWIRPGVLLPAGLVVNVAGFLVMLQTTPGSGVAPLIAGFAISCAGGGPLLTIGIGLVVGAAPPEKAGSASALAQTANEFGYAFGVAILGSIVTAVYGARIAGSGLDLSEAAQQSLAGAVDLASTLPGATAAVLLEAAHGAYAAGLHAVVLTAAAGLTIVAACLAVNLKHLPVIGGQEPAAADHGTPSGG